MTGTDRLTPAHIRRAIAMEALRRAQVEPQYIKTKAEAARQNRISKSLGLRPHWRVGDPYFILRSSLIYDGPRHG